MGHQEECDLRGLCQSQHNIDDDISRRLVGITCRLIGKNEGQSCRKRTSDRHPLLLTAGELFGIACKQLSDPQRLDQAFFPDRVETARQPGVKRDIGSDIEARNEIELLED
jgi:hypothetical protein